MLVTGGAASRAARRLCSWPRGLDHVMMLCLGVGLHSDPPGLQGTSSRCRFVSFVKTGGQWPHPFTSPISSSAHTPLGTSVPLMLPHKPLRTSQCSSFYSLLLRLDHFQGPEAQLTHLSPASSILLLKVSSEFLFHLLYFSVPEFLAFFKYWHTFIDMLYLPTHCSCICQHLSTISLSFKT